ncbi:hypothetical protein PFISCL1PPCAC_18778, partial [Pristionchus fissidentatus]
ILLISLCVLFSFTEAYILFENSVIIDESDIDGKATFDVPLVCDDCHVYISLPQSSARVAAKLSIGKDKNSNMRFNSIARMKGDNEEKGYWDASDDGPLLQIFNKNKKLKSAPFLAWIVQANTTGINSTQIFDASSLLSTMLYSGTITVMNTEPFTVNVFTAQPLIMSATAAGFDMVSDSSCANVVEPQDSVSYLDMSLWVSSPIITF